MKYLFAHFTGEHEKGEQIYFSISEDGLNWTDLNGGKAVVESKLGEKGVRDPFIVKDGESGKYFMIATDLRIANGKGWEKAQFEGSKNMVVWESNDLINWGDGRIVAVGIDGAGCVWAPEAIYDKEKKAFFVYFASNTKNSENDELKQKIYSCWTKDFVNFTETKLYIEKENHIIDTTMVYDNGNYYRFSKDETTKTIIMEKSPSIEDDCFEEIKSETLANLFGVEGPEIFQLENGKWCLMVDRFSKGTGYQALVIENLGSGEFAILEDNEYNMGETLKRHGGIIEITDKEYERLQWFYSIQNPVIKGLYADPAIYFFDEKMYIYPTTDGHVDWSGHNFSVFSSDDGINFVDEGVIVDVVSNQVEWATGSAWAPCATKRDGFYYYYFCAKDLTGKSCIGVAKSESPTGPFVAEKTPLLTMELMKENNIKMGQTIDPAIYIEDGEYYILFGNCEAAIAKLAPDMFSIEVETLKNIEGLFDFREAVDVFKKDGLYHFTWSCDDTRSEDYHVNYGISDTLYGPVTFEKTILEKDVEKGILGTGHHSIVKNETKDEYYIAYHRFGTPLENFSEDIKGFNREVCLSLITFENNRIEKVVVR